MKKKQKAVKGSPDKKLAKTTPVVPKKEKAPGKKIYILLLIIIVIIAYARTTNFDFVKIDDEKLIYENPLVTDHSVSYSQCLQQFIYTAYYKPIVFLTWKAEYELFGSDPSHFHLINWLLHLINTILVFFVGLQLFRRLYKEEKLVLLSSFALALLFSINPLRIESVAWATERKDMLFSFFFLSGWLLYIRYIQTNRYLLVILGCLLYFLSGLSKSMGLSLVAVLFLTDLWYKRNFKLKLFIEKLPYIAVFAVLLILYGIIHLQGAPGTTVPSPESGGEVSNQITSLKYINGLPFLLQFIVTASTKFVLWIIHSFIPVKLSIVYPHDKIYGFFGRMIFILPVIIAALFWWAWKKRKTSFFILGGLSFFAITISPVLAQPASGQAVFLSDRYTYIASIGLFFILIAWMNQLKISRARYYILLSAISLFYFLITMVNINNWKNSENLFSHALKIYPESGLAHLNLGKYYREQNNYDRAIEVYSEGIKYEPGYYELYNNRAKIYFDKGQMDSAIKDLDKCLSMAPDYVQGLTNRSSAYGVKQEWDKSLADLDKVLSIEPDNLNALGNRGQVYYEKKEYQKSINDLQRYLQLKAGDADIINIIGLCYINLDETDKAISTLSQAIEIKSSDGAIFMNRSLAYNKKGDKANALKDALKAQELKYNVDPNYIESLKVK